MLISHANEIFKFETFGQGQNFPQNVFQSLSAIPNFSTKFPMQFYSKE
jgi:hypothetical protein